MKQTILLLLALILSSCSGEKATNIAEAELSAMPEKVKTTEEYHTKKIELITFNTLPEEIDGCGCALFKTKQDWQNESYIYADAGNIACIKIDDEILLLNLSSYNEETGVLTYANGQYTLTRKSYKSSPSVKEETTNVDAIIILTNGTEKVEVNLIGYCGC